MFRITKKAAVAAALTTGCALMLAVPATGAPGGNSMNRYQFVYENVTWDAANSAAMAAGGHLVTITSAKEYQRVRGMVGSDPIWLGGTDSAQEGVWRWVDGGVFFVDDGAIDGAAVRGAVSYWDQNDGYNAEPNNSDGVEHCLEMQADGTWNDLGCSNVNQMRPYIIEFD
jgi:hypothetical protein